MTKAKSRGAASAKSTPAKSAKAATAKTAKSSDAPRIITTPDPRLREKSDKVRQITPEVLDIIANMRELSTEWEKAHPFELSAAMAAPQMGVNQRIIIIRDNFENKEIATFTALINPEIIRADGKTVVDYEGCLSVPYVYAEVPRKNKVRVKAKLENGQEVRIKATGELARTLQHEIDHLDGILFIDRVKDDKDAFYKMDEKGDLQPVDYDKEIAGNTELFPDD